MANLFDKLFGQRGPNQRPTLFPEFSDWTEGVFHHQIGSGSETAAILAFGSPKPLFDQSLTPSEAGRLVAQLDHFARSPWAAAGIANAPQVFPKYPASKLRVMVQYAPNAAAMPRQVFEAEYDWPIPRKAGQRTKGGVLTVTDGQAHYIV